MPRIVSIWLPAWPIDRLRRAFPALVPESHPFALVEKGPHGLRIHALNHAALATGVRIGQPIADVRAMLPDIAVRPATPREDADALSRLVSWLGRYAPLRNQEGTDGAWIDITGAAHLLGGEEALLADLVDRLGRLGIAARAGLADTYGAAHALARWRTSAQQPIALAEARTKAHAARRQAVDPIRTALALLPVAALRLAPATVQLLERLGLKRVGLLYDLPREAIERRFREAAGSRGRRAKPAVDEATAVLRRLDQALGHLPEPLTALAEPMEAMARLAFAEPLVSHEAVLAALDLLARELCDQLASRCRAASRFRLSLYRADGTLGEILAGTSRPGCDPHHISRLLQEKLAGFDLGFGLDLLTLEAEGVELLLTRQSAFDDAHSCSDEGAGLLLDRLVNRLGRDRVVRLEVADSHQPERSEHFHPAVEGRAMSRPLAVFHTARPPFLIVPPEPADVLAEIPEGAPLRLMWRRIARRITRAEGPERIAPDWWRDLATAEDAKAVTRDYYRLEDESGGGYWVFRDGRYDSSEGRPPRWYVHGVWP